MKSIPCTYKGVKMRSRLEATWAAVLDNYGIEWVYEPEGYELSDGTLYLPDFYLPRANMIFEVKGVMTEFDEHKIRQWVADAHRPAAIGFPDGRFKACSRDWEEEVENWVFDDGAFINKCSNCGGVSFMAFGAYWWICPCCNSCDGDHWINPLTATGGGDGLIPNFTKFYPNVR